MKKRLISGMAAAVLALSGGGAVADTGLTGLFGGTDIQASAFSGWCVSGDCDVIFDEDGTVTVRKNGEKGAMDGYIYSCPWDNYKDYIKKIVIEEGVTYIGLDAFENCKNLTSIQISSSVTVIGSSAFGSCPKLSTVTVNAKTPPKLDSSYVFDGASDNLKIYVPTESVRAYKAAWSNYAFKIEANPNTTPVTVNTTPKVTSVAYNEKYHQFKVDWSAVDGAQNYGVAVYLAGKWKVQKQDIPAGTTSFTSPKLTPGKTYRMVVCAKVNGSWDISNIEKRAFNVTIQ